LPYPKKRSTNKHQRLYTFHIFCNATDAARNVLREISNKLLREEKALSNGVTAIILRRGIATNSTGSNGDRTDKLEALAKAWK
jgi:hypothetical protein